MKPKYCPMPSYDAVTMSTSFNDVHTIKKKMAIISTYNENCGNASYTHVLKKAFSKYVDVDVIPLDLFCLQAKSSNLIYAGDKHIKNICSQVRNYDYVNIQFEAGLYGASIKHILRRIRWLIDASPNLTLTMHRVDADDTSFAEAVSAGIKSRSYHYFKVLRGASKFSGLSKSVINYCGKASKKKNVIIKVHTRRESRSVKEIYLNNSVYDYPLAFLNKEERCQAWINSDRNSFLRKHGFADNDKVFGLFGYLSNYKGIETAVEALSLLPEEYKLGLFGSQHPQTVKRGEAINPYLKSIFDLMEDIDKKKFEDSKKSALISWFMAGGRDGGNLDAVDAEKFKRISDRIRFIGSLPDPEFIEALRLCDAVVLPYLEVGQSMSGVAVLGMEAGAKMICANNRSFAETRRYYPDSFLGFDMGNFYELAQKIVHCTNNPETFECREARAKAFLQYNIEESVKLQLKNFGFTDFGE